MKNPTSAAVAAALLLAMFTGCPNTPDPVGSAPVADTSLAAQSEIRETLPATESTAVAAAADSPPAEPKQEPAPKPEPEPEPKALPRMWDFGSTNCLPCVEMEKVLTPMVADYAGKVDIRIINVYEEQELARHARIQVIPTQIFYDPDGEELFRHIGVYPRDSIVARFKEFGWE
jgi:thioredoxin 1